MSDTMTVDFDFHVKARHRGRKVLCGGPRPAPPAEPGRVPRVAKLMALAIRFDGLLRDGIVCDYAELARLGRVSRARMTQIMNLLLLAPDLQERLLFLPRVTAGRDPATLGQLQRVALMADWKKQRTAMLRVSNGPD